MNSYTVRFPAQCPANNLWIEYTLTIHTGKVIRVEEILDTVHAIRTGYHEDLADSLCAKFGGTQTLKAHHHGVDIETTRPHIAHWAKGGE